MTFDLATATTLQTLQALREQEISSVELLDAMIANIERFNPEVNAVVAQDLERARVEATAADDLRAAGDPMGGLHGLPMTIKDTYATLDLVTTAGSPDYADHMPEKDATVVRLLRRAGAIVWAKTNVPLFAGDHQTYNDVYGRTNNPWNTERTAGGSSGGAAVSIACGFSTAEVGSDVGGSIRQPSALNGVFGLKTTHGLVGGRGHIPGPPGTVSEGDLTVHGPMGRSCGDLKLLLEILTRSATAFRGVPGARLQKFDRQPDIANMRIGVWADDAMSPVDREVVDVITGAAADLEGAGAQVRSDLRPATSSEELHHIYLRLLNSGMSGGVSSTAIEKFAEAAGDGWGPSTDYETNFARGVRLPHREWMRVHERRVRVQLEWEDIFRDIDVMIAPVQPVPAFPHNTEQSYGHRTLAVNGTELPYPNLLFWAGLATMPHLPSLTIPLGLSEVGLPIGIQLIGPTWSDHKLCSLGEEIASVLGVRFTPPPMVRT